MRLAINEPRAQFKVSAVADCTNGEARSACRIKQDPMTGFGTNKARFYPFPTTHSRDNMGPSAPWHELHGNTKIDFTKETPLHDFES